MAIETCFCDRDLHASLATVSAGRVHGVRRAGSAHRVGATEGRCSGGCDIHRAAARSGRGRGGGGDGSPRGLYVKAC